MRRTVVVDEEIQDTGLGVEAHGAGDRQNGAFTGGVVCLESDFARNEFEVETHLHGHGIGCGEIERPVARSDGLEVVACNKCTTAR
jgi:hypothetical protein